MNWLRCRCRWWGPVAALWFAGQLAAQQPVTPDPIPPAALARIVAVVDPWLESEQSSEALLGKTVDGLLGEPAGLRWLGGELPNALTRRSLPRNKGLVALATHAALEVLKRTSSSGMVFAGQYDPLLPLQPFVGDLFFQLLTDTPDWYPDTHRIQLVPALRDLYPTPPAAPQLDAIVALVEDTAVEPEPLREAAACMLWQWGKKSFVQPRLERLQKESGEGDSQDRAIAMLALADLQYQLRDYRTSAQTHYALHKLVAANHLPLKPNDYYSAVCVWSLSGNLDRAFEVLTKVAELQNDPGTDSSHRLERRLLEGDPEIAPLRKDPRWQPLFAKMFPGDAKPAVGR